MTTGNLFHISDLQFLVLLNRDINSFPISLSGSAKDQNEMQMGNCFGNWKVLHMLTIIAVLFNHFHLIFLWGSCWPCFRGQKGSAGGGLSLVKLCPL